MLLNERREKCIPKIKINLFVFIFAIQGGATKSLHLLFNMGTRELTVARVGERKDTLRIKAQVLAKIGQQIDKMSVSHAFSITKTVKLKGIV
jgi:hypothetical protein